jgi:hypothetical protein
MKRLLLGMMIFGGAALLGGCPIYPDQGSSYQVCGQCCTSSDCGPGFVCSADGECLSETSAVDASTSASGPCGVCPTGTTCTLSGGTLQCMNPDGVGLDASFAMDTSLPSPVDDASADGGSEAAPTGELCNADSQCTAAGVGSKCIDGLCTVESHLCSDGTQCLVAGDSCVDGVCIPTCGAREPPCPAGYACDFNRDVCSVNPVACTASSQCQGGAVCVDARCVAPCAPAEAGAQCSTGQVCVNGGCIPDQQAHFTCQNDGSVGSLASTCDPSSVCLHGDCYATCDAEGGGCAVAGESCKSVTIAKGTFEACATATTLGSDCDPAVGSYCSAPKLCLDGYCR